MSENLFEWLITFNENQFWGKISWSENQFWVEIDHLFWVKISFESKSLWVKIWFGWLILSENHIEWKSFSVKINLSENTFKSNLIGVKIILSEIHFEWIEIILSKDPLDLKLYWVKITRKRKYFMCEIYS